MKNYKFSMYERRIVISVCIIFIVRMLGMFMITPAMHTTSILLFHKNKVLIGIVIGIYGLMQSICQIPFGFLTNKIGYKYTIFIGLFLFFLGSTTLCVSNSIFGIIIGRGLQGIGTVSSIFMALLSDVIREQNYIKAVSCVGVSFGISFLFAIIVGPIIIQYIGLYGLFNIIFLASLLCIFIAFKYIFPYCDNISYQKKYTIMVYESNIFIKRYDIFGYIISIFFLHFLLTLNFVIFPKNMELLGYVLNMHCKIYMFTVILSLLIVSPIIILSEKKQYIWFVMLISIILIIISPIILLIFKFNFFIFFTSIYFFFISFLLLETFLPSLLSRILLEKYKNIIMSIYSTSQFLGTALGGMLGGLIYHVFGMFFLIILNFIISTIWLIVFYFISKPKYIFTMLITLEKVLNLNIINNLKSNPGIISIKYIKSDNILLIKFDTKKTNITVIKNILQY